MPETTNTYPAGTLAYIDSLCGLIPCKVIDVFPDLAGSVPGIKVTRCKVKITARRPGFQVGELYIKDGRDIIPRNHVYTRCGQFRIRGSYKWIK